MQSDTTYTSTGVNGSTEEKKENFFAESKKLLESYIKDKILLFKLEAARSAAHATAGLARVMVLSVFAILAMLFISITLGFVFSELTGSFIGGFGIVAAIYILLVIIVAVSGKWLRRKVADAVVKAIYSSKKKEHDADSYSSGN